ncbi:UbiA prenyltransferase family protein [Candidatus Roizmanbacteria bacterium]|nr:UbiA prenyltransferase family protein [Candidatus Roizmanbacteria bacterium]
MTNKKGFIHSVIPYIQIARPDHWFKNVFMIPGVVFALYDAPSLLSLHILFPLLIALIATCLIASSNYTINEILDAPKDCFHPIKKNRPIPSGKVNVTIAYIQWIVLAVLGLAIGWQLNSFFFYSLLFLLIMGFLYNIPPVRLKDIPYLDVLSEAINNSIRLCLGWFAVNDQYPPTLSLVMAYWMIGAFFMAIKRFAEYKRIGDPAVAASYRKSFAYYNEYRLILSIVYYASAFSFFFGIFIARYRLELVLSIPFLAGFIPLYMRMGFWADSPAQYPEKLYKVKGLMLYTSFCFLVLIALLFVDVPFLEKLLTPAHIPGK